MSRDLEESRIEGKGETPWFLKLAFFGLIVWAIYYFWRGLLK
ncbi:MAG TPA: hypothetical protein ACFYD3_10210 [Candidatus Hypogeohydataceae bacterium YC41]